MPGKPPTKPSIHQGLALAAVLGIAFIAVARLAAQDPAPQAPAAGRGRGGRAGRGAAAAATATGAAGASGAPGRAGGGGGAYPSRPPADPTIAARGKALYDANCASCHAPDLRGASNGINLVRSQLVLDDQHGELIGKVLQTPHAKGQAPKMEWNEEQILDIATFMHTFQNYRSIVKPPDPGGILVGNASAGQTYFAAKCASCHSVTGDLKGIGTKYSDPKTLQNTLVSGGGGGGRGGRGGGGGGPVTTVTVTMANGQKLEGNLVSRDDFLVSLVDSDGVQHTIRRNGDVPKVEVHDPMKAHRDLLPVYTDDDIHNLTAYLVTIK
jgi:cytochrome c oxidase cbb3-type subunit III